MTEQKFLEQPIAGDRRIVTILFCDVKGSTAMAEKLDPEEWAAIMNRAYEYLIAPVSRRGGTVAQLLGDAILAYFGAPLAHEDDPQRAVLAGLEIIAGIRTFREQLQEESGLDFNVRVGINTGLVMAGEIGSGQRVNYTAVGDTVNLAARMEQTAQPGTVQITANTHKLVAALFDCESLGQIEVKGKSEPIQAYRVLGLKEKPSPVRGFETQGLRSPLVGREMERATIAASLDRLLQGHGGIVGLIGEMGLGKSRLVIEARAGASGVTWLEGHTLSFGQTISYWPFQQILRGWAGISENDDAGSSWLKLESGVRKLFGEETIDYLPYLASLLAFEVRGEYTERVKYLEGDAMGKQIFLTTRRFFERLARNRPTVLVFEDLHWMDASSVALLEHLLPLVETVPLLIIGLSRPEHDTPGARLHELSAHEYADHYREIRLAPLSHADSARLIHNLLEIENLPLRLRELIMEKAEGNPFFLEEVIRTLIDTGSVRRNASSGRWQVTAQIESLHMPDTIQGLIMARVDRLDEEVKQVLRVASIIGRSFLYRVLKAITEASQGLDESLSQLQQTELIHEKQAAPELEYMFKHALAQEATYESILLKKRRELHARVAQAIESLFAERLEEFYGLLAYHYAKAEVWDKAQAYLLKAADQAGQIAANAEALTLYEQAIAAYARAFGDKWDRRQRASLERKIGQSQARRGEIAQALEHLHRAEAYLDYPFPRSQAGVRRELLQELAIQAGHRLLPRLFLNPGPKPDNVEYQEFLLLGYELSYIYSFSDLEAFFLLNVRSLNLWERLGFSEGIALSSTPFAIILDGVPAYGIADYYHHRATTLGEQLGLPYILSLAYYGMALHKVCQGELDLAMTYGRRSAAAFREAGDLHGWGAATFVTADLLAYQGELAEAVRQGIDLVRFGQDGVDLQMEGWGEAVQGLAKKRIGHLHEAAVHLQRAIQLTRTAHDAYTGVVTSGELGQCYLRQNELQQALAAFEDGEQLGRGYRGIGNAHTPLRHGKAEACLLQAERAAPSEKARWLRKAKRACKTALKQIKAFRPGAPEAMLLQGRYEWLRGRPEAARKWWLKGLADARQIGMRYDQGMIHLEVGQRLNEYSELEKAEAIFAEIGAEFDLAKTKELLRR
jgi:class 3 adenylate cyclase